MGVMSFGLVLFIMLVVIPSLVLFAYLIFLIIKVLRKYLKSADVRKEKNEIKKSLGEVLKAIRCECKMTQEFVAESLGVSRQAVSKWESGKSDPSTSNLLALAKLYNISAEEILSRTK